MTHFLQRTVLILLGGSALCAASSAAWAEPARPLYPIQLAVARAGDEPQLILAAHRHAGSHKAAGPSATYVVKKGDTLGSIADKLGVGLSELKAANGLKRNTIQPGTVLKNPKVKPPPAPEKKQSGRKGSRHADARPEPTPAPETYVVKRGDTIFSIARRHGLTMEELRAANGISRIGQIHTGQTLKLGADTAEADAAAADEMARRAERKASRGSRSADTAEETTSGRAAAGRVVTVPGKAASYTVRKGDSLERIARKLDTTVDALKRDNHLRKGAIHPGQHLRGPSTTAKAYVAASGDSLDDVARRFGVSAQALRAENGLSRHAAIRAGQRLRLPDGYRDHGPSLARPPEPRREEPAPSRRPREEIPAPTPTQPADEGTIRLPSSPQPYAPSGQRQPTPRYNPPQASGQPPSAAPTAAPPPTDAQISALGRGRFIWPLRGDALSEFGPKAGNQRNDGLNIQANTGDPVRAAADGDVVYAGDQVPGFGNVVLLQHADGWVTVYGHLSHIDVKNRQKVSQGQQIGAAGSTGVSEPQLHFEVRYAPSPLEGRARPIDPRLVLPR